MLAEETLVVILTDAAGTPLTDATVALEGNMNHAGMIPVLANPVADDADGSADGRYHLPFTFTMLGDWIVTVNVTRADGSSFSRNLEVRAGAEGVEGDEVVPLDATPAQDEQSDAEDGAQAETAEEAGNGGSASAGVQVQEPVARPAPLAGGTGAVYFLLYNAGSAEVRLIGGDSPAAGAVEIHSTQNDNGVIRMRQLTEGLLLAPGESAHLMPGGMHLMLVDLAAPLAAGDSVEVTLRFEGAEELTFSAPVVAMDDLPAEAEHAHD
jgi:copper(I)-binding protein